MHYTIGTAGHIDHGKTTLVRALTGMETDTLAEEKKRGLSINLGFAHFEAANASDRPVSIAIVDVPGHERFIRNMLAGTTGIDAVLLVIAADDGVMPQTREHADILSLLGVSSGVVAITKCDAVEGDRISEVKGQISALLKNSSLEGSPVIETSAISGVGMDALKTAVVAKCLAATRRLKGPFFRLPIDRSFAATGFGAVVTGTIASGKVSTNDEVKVFPSGETCRVRGIESLHMTVNAATSGERAAINLKGASHQNLSRGMAIGDADLIDYVLSSLSGLERSRKRFSMDCAFEFTRAGDSLFPLKDQAQLKLFHQTSVTNARIRFLRKREVMAGERVYGRLSLDSPVLALRGDRFIMRDASKNRTIGGGTVLLTHYSQSFMKKLDETDFEALERTDRLIQALFKANEPAISLKNMEYVLNMSKAELDASIGGYVIFGDFLADPRKIDSLKDEITSVLGKFHKEHPTENGLDEPALFDTIKKTTRLSARFCREVISALVSEKKITRNGSLLKLAQARAELPQADKKIETAILGLFKPGISAIGDEDLKTLGINGVDLKRVLTFLIKANALVRIAEGRYITVNALSRAKERLVAELRTRGKAGIKAAEYRDAIGAGRKLAIELLEYFDCSRVTLRSGDVRTLRES
jgi:selenocysteine-specific elongation factor